jgi:dCMP deaminase
MPDQRKLDALYMDIARRVAQMSHGVRAKVGAVLVNNDNIISYGWNGTPAGDDNSCETQVDGPDGPALVTKPEVLHAESNCLMKLVASDGATSSGATLYVTLSPCFECSKLIKQARVKRVVWGDAYRDTSGVDFLSSRGVEVQSYAQAIGDDVRPGDQPASPGPAGPDTGPDTGSEAGTADHDRPDEG